MSPETHAALNGIASAFCDNLCRWPQELKDEDALAAECAACRPMLDLANLVERLESQPDTHTHTPLPGQMQIEGW